MRLGSGKKRINKTEKKKQSLRRKLDNEENMNKQIR